MPIRLVPLHAARAAALSACLALGPAAAASTLQPWPAGQATPALAVVDLAGKDWNLASLRGKVVVLNFWASWCEPCVKELPALSALPQRPAWDGQVVVVGVNYKESLDAIRAFTADHPIPYTVLRDRSGDMFKRWGTRVFPLTVVLDREGRARWRLVGELGPYDMDMRRSIDALVAEPAKNN